MKKTVKNIPQCSIEQFAERHDLEMEINERPTAIGDPSRYYANFKGASTKGNHVLISDFGNGATPEQAIAEYAARISLKTLVFGEYSKDRTEIRVPRLTN